MSAGSNRPPDTEVQAALAGVLDGLLASARADIEASDGYKHLFSEFQDGGIAHAVFEAERQMVEIALNLAQIIKTATGKPLDPGVWSVICALPLALDLVERDIRDAQGYGCCVDKTRLSVQTFFYEKLGMNVPIVPFVRASHTQPAEQPQPEQDRPS